jgi:hypothetical protein
MLLKRQKNFLDRYTIGVWEINPLNGLVDIEGDFNYGNFPKNVDRPLRGLRFGNVTGNFIFESSIKSSYMLDLDGFPQRVGKNFSCSRCHIKSLKGGPTEVGGDYYCSFNDLNNFNYAPEVIPGDFIGRFNHELESFEGLPKLIGGDLNLEDGYPWQTKVDTKNLILVYQSEIGGSIKFDGAYREGISAIESLAIPGISMSNILRVMSKRGVI